jgi:hypothetical protein
MFGLGLSLGLSLAMLPALSSGTAPPFVPAGWVLVTYEGSYLVFAGHFLVAKAN